MRSLVCSITHQKLEQLDTRTYFAPQGESIDEATVILVLYGIVFLGLAVLAYWVDEQGSFG